MPLRLGAGRMLLCDSGQFPWRPPPELLREDLDGLMTRISTLEPDVDDSGFCSADGGSGFTLMFGYPDGDVTAVSGDTGGCGTVETGSGKYLGADELLADVIDRFSDARAGQAPPSRMAPAALDCNQGVTFDYVRSWTGRLQDASRALSCWRRNAPEPGAFHVRDVGARDLRALVRDASTHQVRRRDFSRDVCDGFPFHFWQDLLLETTWGDVLVLRGVCDEFLVRQAKHENGRSAYWHPSPQSQRILNRLRR